MSSTVNSWTVPSSADIRDTNESAEWDNLETLLTGTAKHLNTNQTTTIGTFSSSVYGVANSGGVTLSASVTAAERTYADDGGVAITTGSCVRAAVARMLVGGAHSSADVSIYGQVGQLKITGNMGSGGVKGGVWGYAESVSGATVSSLTSGVVGTLDVPSGATIAASAVESALMCYSISLAGTHTGKATAIHVATPLAGTWDYGIIFGTTSGATTANTAKLGTDTCIAVLNVRVGNTDGYIPILAAVPSGS